MIDGAQQEIWVILRQVLLNSSRVWSECVCSNVHACLLSSIDLTELILILYKENNRCLSCLVNWDCIEIFVGTLMVQIIVIYRIEREGERERENLNIDLHVPFVFSVLCWLVCLFFFFFFFPLASSLTFSSRNIRWDSSLTLIIVLIRFDNVVSHVVVAFFRTWNI